MQKNHVDPHKSSVADLDANIVALLAYLVTSVLFLIAGLRYLAWVAPLVLYFIESKSEFVRFHAIQSLVLHALGVIIVFVSDLLAGGAFVGGFFNPLAFVGTGLFSLIGLAASIAVLVFSILAMIDSYKYNEYHVPVIGPVIGKVTQFLGKR